MTTSTARARREPTQQRSRRTVRQILDAADQIVGIPMYGINHSFPVTVAAGIAMAEWTRRHYAT